MALKKIGKYQIISKIGQGGMGAIYKAKHPTLKRTVIIKQLTTRGNQQFVERFKREAQIMLDFRDDRIVQVFDHFKEGASYYIAMEFIDGVPLDKLIRQKGYLSNDAALIIFSEICKGLKYAHDRGVIHRDIKPGNILISKNGEVKLTDFGIATSKKYKKHGLTQKGMILGSPSFMAPEQIKDTKNVDEQADIYSMGVMLYNMVTGKLPYPGFISPETIGMIVKENYTAPQKINPNISNKIKKIVRLCMRTRKKKRCKSLGKVLSYIKTSTSYFKNEKDVHNYLRDYVFYGKNTNIKNNKIKTTKKTRKNKKKLPNILNKKGLIISACLLVTIIALAGISRLPVINNIIQPTYYGTIKFNIRTNPHLAIKKQDIKIEIYQEKKNGKYKKKITPLFLTKNRNERKITGYQSQKITLKSGNYKLITTIKNELFEQNIFLQPYKIQKQIYPGNKYKLININYLKNPHFPLKVYFSFQDKDKKFKLNKVNIKIWHKSKWINWNIFLKYYSSTLVSGKNYTFLMQKAKYIPVKKTIYIDPYQSVYKLNVQLARKPGKLTIRFDKNNYKLLLNKKNYYFTGGNNKQRINLNPPVFQQIARLFNNKKKNKHKVLVLNPGTYFLTVKKWTGKTTTKKLVIRPGNNKLIRIKFNPENKKISIY